MPKLELIGLSYSPYTQKARRALDHHRINYRFTEHLLIFGMPTLRIKTRKFLGDVTVPALVGGSVRLLDSFDIAQYADKNGSGSKLFDNLERVEFFNTLSERGLGAARALLIDKIKKDPSAGISHLPAFVPPSLHKLSLPLVSFGVSYIQNAFQTDSKSTVEHREELRDVMQVLRRELHSGGGKYFLGKLSYGDIAGAVLPKFVGRLEDAEIDKEFSDLVSWSNTILN